MLADVPMVFVLVGITAYTVLSGADFGAGFWTLFPGGGQADALSYSCGHSRTQERDEPRRDKRMGSPGNRRRLHAAQRPPEARDVFRVEQGLATLPARRAARVARPRMRLRKIDQPHHALEIRNLARVPPPRCIHGSSQCRPIPPRLTARADAFPPAPPILWPADRRMSLHQRFRPPRRK